MSNSGILYLTDPYDDSVGFTPLKNVKADYVTVSHSHYDHCYTAGLCGKYELISAPGTIKTPDGQIEGLVIPHDDKGGKLRGLCIAYKFTIDGIIVCHLADIGEAKNKALIDFAKGCDVLMLPIGGTYTIEAKEAQHYTEQIAPHIVVPMHYKAGGCTLNIDKPDKFLSFYPGYEKVAYLKCENADFTDGKYKEGTVCIYMEEA